MFYKNGDEFAFGKINHGKDEMWWKVFRTSNLLSKNQLIAVSKYPVACTMGRNIKDIVVQAIKDNKSIQTSIVKSINKCLAEDYFNLSEQEALYDARKVIEGENFTIRECFKIASQNAVFESALSHDIGKFKDGERYNVFIYADEKTYTYFNIKHNAFENVEYPTDGSFETTEFCVYAAIILNNE